MQINFKIFKIFVGVFYGRVVCTRVQVCLSFRIYILNDLLSACLIIQYIYTECEMKKAINPPVESGCLEIFAGLSFVQDRYPERSRLNDRAIKIFLFLGIACQHIIEYKKIMEIIYLVL